MSPNFASCWRRSTMTQADLFRWLLESTCASSAAIVLVLLLRRPLRATFGANAAYLLWLLPPLAVLAASLPAPVRSEEHTSELQSLMRTSYAVFRFKQKNTKYRH